MKCRPKADNYAHAMMRAKREGHASFRSYSFSNAPGGCFNLGRKIQVYLETVHQAEISAPRSGLGDAAIRELRRLAPRQMAYIASDPAILARDVKQLSWAGYHLVEIQPFDTMPQTHHIHLVALWERD